MSSHWASLKSVLIVPFPFMGLPSAYPLLLFGTTCSSQAFGLVCQNATKIATYDTLIMIQVLIQTSTLYFLTEWSKLLAYQKRWFPRRYSAVLGFASSATTSSAIAASMSSRIFRQSSGLCLGVTAPKPARIREGTGFNLCLWFVIIVGIVAEYTLLSRK
jgi:hypothetical protein